MSEFYMKRKIWIIVGFTCVIIALIFFIIKEYCRQKTKSKPSKQDIENLMNTSKMVEENRPQNSQNREENYILIVPVSNLDLKDEKKLKRKSAKNLVTASTSNKSVQTLNTQDNVTQTTSAFYPPPLTILEQKKVLEELREKMNPTKTMMRIGKVKLPFKLPFFNKKTVRFDDPIASNLGPTPPVSQQSTSDKLESITKDKDVKYTNTNLFTTDDTSPTDVFNILITDYEPTSNLTNPGLYDNDTVTNHTDLITEDKPMSNSDPLGSKTITADYSVFKSTSDLFKSEQEAIINICKGLEKPVESEEIIQSLSNFLETKNTLDARALQFLLIISFHAESFTDYNPQSYILYKRLILSIVYKYVKSWPIYNENLEEQSSLRSFDSFTDDSFDSLSESIQDLESLPVENPSNDPIVDSNESVGQLEANPEVDEGHFKATFDCIMGHLEPYVTRFDIVYVPLLKYLINSLVCYYIRIEQGLTEEEKDTVVDCFKLIVSNLNLSITCHKEYVEKGIGRESSF